MKRKNFFTLVITFLITYAVAVMAICVFRPEQVRLFALGIQWSPLLFFVAALVIIITAAFIGSEEFFPQNKDLTIAT